MCDRIHAAVPGALLPADHCRCRWPCFPMCFSTPTANTLASWPLAGIPSRTRVSPDGVFVASTAFVTGHSYAGGGFSTETRIT